MNNPERKNWIFAIALSLPIVVFISAYLWNHVPGLIPTGFIQYDNVAYIAYAKQYLDAPQFDLQYANPFGYQGEAIYFQPQTIFFAVLLKLGVPPGWILIPFTLVCSIISFRLLISIYDHLVSSSLHRRWNIWLLSWGGGLLVWGGIAAHAYLARSGSIVQDLFLLDPENGWWGLNLGRSLFFSCEAYYHAVFLGCVLSIFKRKFILGILLLFLLSLSHPFTGIELTAIVCLWCLVELFINRKDIPVWFTTGALLIFFFHSYYYLIYLNKFPDHDSVSQQYSLNWRLAFYRMIPAYCLVGALTIVTITKTRFSNFFAIKTNRLLACWFLVAFVLANHEMLIAPKQPIHFTRGYIWTSLFLLGIPALNHLNTYIKFKWRIAGMILVGIVFFLDNFLWITIHTVTAAKQSNPTYITREQSEMLSLLNKEGSNKTIVISNDVTISYLSAVYTSSIPWYSHPFTTPYAARKKNAMDLFFTKGIVDPAWIGQEINFVLKKTDTISLKVLQTQPFQKIITKNTYSLIICRPLK